MSSRPRSTAGHGAGPLRPTADAACPLRRVDLARIAGGFWAQRRRINGEVCIPQGPVLVEAAGNLRNLRLADGQADGAYRRVHPFLDTDVHKWLETAAWQAADMPELDAIVARTNREGGPMRVWSPNS